MKKILAVCSLMFLCGCEPNARGFVLPDGDLERGASTFQALECDACHSVGDIAWQGGEDTAEVPLGGTVTRVKTYGQLVTSVINPSHRIARSYLGEEVAEDGESKMRRYNDVMTVQQLVDVVTYLQSQYELVMPHSPYAYRTF